MSIIHFDSFDHLQTSDLTLKWNKIIYGATEQPTITTDAGFTDQGLRIYRNSGVYVTIVDSNPLIVGFLFRPTTFGSGTVSGTILTLGDAIYPQVYLSLLSSGAIRIYNGADTLLGQSANSLIHNEWVHIEFKVTVSSTAGSYELRINGSLDSSKSGLVTQYTTSPIISTVGCANFNGGPGAIHDYDSFVVIDTAGGRFTDFIGPSDISVLLVNGDGATVQSTPTSATNWQSIDGQYPNTDVEYASFLDSNQLSLFHFQDLVKRDGAIFAAALRADMRKLKGGIRQVELVSRPGTADQTPSPTYGSINYTYSNIFYITESPLYHSAIYESNPATGGTLTVDSVNEWQGGPRRIS